VKGSAPPVAAERRSAGRAAAALFAVLVGALGLYGLSFQATLPRRLPSPSDWQAAAAHLAREARAGDAVVLAPWWAERARAVLPPALPVLAFPRLAGEDLPGLRRLWLLALPAAPGGTGDVAGDLRGWAGVPGATTRFGGLALTPFSLAEPAVPLAFLPDRLAGAPGAAREVREVEYLPRECLVVKLSPGAPPLRVTFEDVPLGRTLRGHTGIVGEAALAGEEPVRVAVDLDGARVAEVEEPAAVPGWHAFDIDTSSHAGRAARVTFTISTDDPGPRPLCLDAYTLP
jgi:hypothetical protein